jgi:23S rRNA (adenine2503-C2)-methyltransferase
LPRAPRFDPVDLVAAGEAYARATGYPIQYQWTLIEGVNDGDDEIEGIVRLLSGKYALMNLIPYNTVDGMPWRRPAGERAALAFTGRFWRREEELVPTRGYGGASSGDNVDDYGGGGGGEDE